MKEVGKIVEVVSTSKKSFDDAINKAVEEFSRKEKGLRGIDIVKMTVKVENGKVDEYRVNLKVAVEY